MGFEALGGTEEQIMKWWSRTVVRGGLMGFGSVACACSPGDARDAEATSQTREALTLQFELPIPAGSNPQNIVLGATRGIYVNDRAEVRSGTLESVYGDVAAMGSTPTSSFGAGAWLKNIWSRRNILLRGAHISYYKVAAVASVQAGTTFVDPEENRNLVFIRQDPMWTVSLTGTDSGAPVNVEPNQTSSIPPGQYGQVTVKGTLQLNGAGNYQFVGFDLEPQGSVVISDPLNTTITVTSSLILRGQVGGPVFGGTGLIFAYLGTATAAIERRFTGDLFLAPRASIEIKQPSQANFFGVDVTVFEGVIVTGAGKLNPRALQLVSPTATVTQLGEIAPNAYAGEISSTILSPTIAPSCGSNPVAFISHQAADVYRGPIGASGFVGGTTLPTLPPANPTAIPASCIGVPLPGYPGVPHLDAQFQYPNLPGGTPYYVRSGGTDNLTARLPGGRVIQVGGAARSCRDPVPANPASCPQGPVFPQKGSACQPNTYPALCFAQDPVLYSNPNGTVQVRDATDIAARCLTLVSHSGAGPDIELGGSSALGQSGIITITTGGDRDTASFSWSYGGESAINVPGAQSVVLGTTGYTALLPAGTYVAGTQYTWGAGGRWMFRSRRVESSVTSVRMSTDCGATWTAKAIDPFEMGLPYRSGDRIELYVDPYEDRIFVIGPFLVGFGGIGGGRNLILVGGPKSATNAGNMTFAKYCEGEPCDAPYDGAPVVLTTVLDEKALMPNGNFGRWVHVVRARCLGESPLLDVETPFGWRTLDLRVAGDEFRCSSAPSSVSGVQITNGRAGNITLVEIPSVPPKVRVAYPSLGAGGNRWFTPSC
jgi:hypothetical protein